MALTSSSFDSARLKIQRANSHIAELQATVAELTSSDFYKLVMEADPRTGCNSLSYVPIKPVPQSIPLIIGDTVHNLRAAFDHIASECIRANGGSGKSVHFPFDEMRKNLISNVHLSAIERALPGARRVILDEVKPYANGNGDKAIWCLNKIDNIDKHNLLIITTKATFISPFIVMTGGASGIVARAAKFDAEKPLKFLIADANVTIDHQVKATFEIFFAEPNAIKDEPVVPTLIYVSQRMGEIINLFTALI